MTDPYPPPRIQQGRLGVRLRKLVVVVLALAAVLAAGLPAMAAPGAPAVATVTLSPASATISGCETVAVEVRVNGVTDLYGADVRLQFDPTALEVVDADTLLPGIQIEPGGFLAPPLSIARNTADNTLGTIQYAATQLNPTLPASGSGAIAIIYLRGRASGTSSLQFNLVQLAIRDAEEIPSTAVDGSVTVTPPAAPSLLSIALQPNLTTARLSWPVFTDAPAVALYRDPAPYFTPAPPPYVTVLLPVVSYDDAGAVGDPAINHYYVSRAECASGLASAHSNRVGEFDYTLVPGTP